MQTLTPAAAVQKRYQMKLSREGYVLHLWHIHWDLLEHLLLNTFQMSTEHLITLPLKIRIYKNLLLQHISNCHIYTSIFKQRSVKNTAMLPLNNLGLN